jgi:hypothetical protein
MVQGHSKGSSFERTLCRQFSLWITKGERNDIFWRNVISGGQFTFAASKGRKTGVPGDIRATDPLGFEFLSLFMVEAKHHRSIRLEQYMFDKTDGKGFLAKLIATERKKAETAKLHWLVIAKQNNREPMVFCTPEVMVSVLACAYPLRAFVMHLLHNNSVAMMPLSSFLLAEPTAFLRHIKNVVGKPRIGKAKR